MRGAIRNIGMHPFFVYYWTNVQVHVYNKYCQKGYARLSIDATGSIVRRFRKVSGDKTNHIFLYECTVGDSSLSSQYSVSNMLSESHNALAIYTWLASWIRTQVVGIPNEVVTDMSLALMYAVVMAFTKFKTLDDYIKHCYESLFLNKHFEPGCFIRNDVAHMMKLISEWPCLKNQHRLTKRFYLKSIGQIIQTCVDDAENVIQAMFTVALSDTEGTNSLELETTCEQRKKWLQMRK